MFTVAFRIAVLLSEATELCRCCVDCLNLCMYVQQVVSATPLIRYSMLCRISDSFDLENYNFGVLMLQFCKQKHQYLLHYKNILLHL